jgi:hypothetical protein
MLSNHRQCHDIPHRNVVPGYLLHHKNFLESTCCQQWQTLPFKNIWSILEKLQLVLQIIKKNSVLKANPVISIISLATNVNIAGNAKLHELANHQLGQLPHAQTKSNKASGNTPAG